LNTSTGSITHDGGSQHRAGTTQSLCNESRLGCVTQGQQLINLVDLVGSDLPPLLEPPNSQFFQPMAIGLMVRSADFLSGMLTLAL
jgi:hypothetical protein